MTENKTSDVASKRALARRELVRDLAQASSGKARLERILSAPECEAIVPTLPVESLFLTIKEVGLGDSAELVQLSSPRQFQAFLDLDSWQRDHFDHSKAIPWLRAARADANEERYRRKLSKLDMEILEFLITRTVQIHDLEETEDPDTKGVTYRSPEGRYLLELKVEGAEYAGIRGLLDDLYAEDPFKAARLMESVRWELLAELEETALHWRNARLEDLGFPKPEEALSLYAYVDPDEALPKLGELPELAGTFVLSRMRPAGRFFDEVARRLEDRKVREILERQLVAILNSAMVVEGTDPGDLEQAARVVSAVRDTLSLGLEHAAKGDPVRGEALVVEVPLKRVFQVGVSLGLSLKHRADRMIRLGKASLPSAVNPKNALLFDSPLAEVISAVRRKRPLFCEALEAEGSLELRPFRDRGDLEKVSRALEEARRVVQLMEKLGFDSAQFASSAAAAGIQDLAAVRFSNLVLTAVASEALGDDFGFELMPESKRSDAAAIALEHGERLRVTPAFEKLLRDRLAGAANELSRDHEATARCLADQCLARLLEEAPTLAAGGSGPFLFS